MDLREKIDVMEACERGEVIQVRAAHRTVKAPWTDTAAPVWDWSYNMYRVKPVPRERWINLYSGCGNDVAHHDKPQALSCAGSECTDKAVLFREVVED